MIEKETSETLTPKRFYAVERYQSEIFLSSFNLIRGTSSGFNYNNYFNNEQIIRGNPDASAQLSFADPGLHGIDVLAIDAQGSPQGNEKYYTSAWQHIPVIVEPGQDYDLIFNIRDSYQEFHHNMAYACGSCPTGICKEVELNGVPIWREDIPLGGDGWERVSINIKTDVDLNQNPIINLITTDGKPNRLTFSIYIDPAVNVPPGIPTDKVKGLLVFVDDVYLKSFGNPENLIKDGDVERSNLSTGLEISTPGLAKTDWYQPYGSQVSYANCCSQGFAPPQMSNETLYYPDGTPVIFVANGPATVAAVSGSLRKSGNHAIILKLPALAQDQTNSNCTICTTYVQHSGIVISAATNIDFRGLLGCDDYANTFPSGIITGTSNYGPSPTAATVYRLTSDLQVGNGTTATTLNCEGCVVAISPGIKITVKNSATLNLKRKSITNELAGLFACSDMWQGIIIEPGGTVMIDDSVSIKDALTALRCEGNGTDPGVPTLRINSQSAAGTTCVFDHNNIDIELINDDYDAAFYCFPASFLCTDRFLPKAPMRGELAFAHIVTHEAKNVTFGNYHTYTGHVKNAVEDAHYGINAITSDITAWHTDFKNIALEEEKFEPSAIFSQSESIVNLNVGSVLQASTNRYLCNFNNCGKGINAIGDIQTSINKNDFHNNTLDVLLSYNTTQSISIQDNNSDSAFNSIMLFDNTTQQLITVTGNHLKSRHDEAGVPAGKHGIGIYYAYNAKLNLNVDQNELTDFPLGIRIINADKLANSIFNVTQNIINFNFDESKLGENLYRGIFMSNSSGVKIANNTIKWNSGLTNPARINSHADQVMGMRMEKVQTSDIKDNTVTTCGTGMYMQNDCSGTYTTCNSFNDNYPGVFLDNITLPNQIGNCEASKNSWTGDYSSHERISGQLFPPNRIRWYFSGVANQGNSTYPFPAPSNLILPVSSTCVSTLVCNSGSGQLVSDDNEKKNEELSEIVDEPQMYIYYPDENEYMNNEYSYSTLKGNDSLINNSERFQFVSENDLSNLGKLHEAKQLAQNGNITAAYLKNNEISNANTIEQNKKTVNEIYFSGGSKIKDTLTTSDSVIFISMAPQRAIDIGEAAYWARGKLRRDDEDNNISNLRTVGKLKQNANAQARVRAHPNPAKEQLVIESLSDDINLQKVVLFDSYGQEIISSAVSSVSKLLDLSGIHQGIYFLKVYLENNTGKTLRVTILR